MRAMTSRSQPSGSRAVQLCSLDQRVDYSCPLAALVGAGEDIVLNVSIQRQCLHQYFLAECGSCDFAVEGEPVMVLAMTANSMSPT